ncbi:MAG TPA: glycosyltransferase [Opitutaceae bacterium]|jgi:glycosyltransferase involved in cell wall biosynthesis|nr:glycosyltransferase [Opitutaceae bacterium]
MKILVLQDRLRSGGTERQSVLLSGAFAAAGHEVQLLTLRPGGALAAPPGVPRRSLQPFDLGLDWFAPGLGGAVARFGPQVVLAMGRMANCYAGGLQRRFPRAAVVATFRTGKPLPRLFRRSLGQVRHALANSREAREVLIARYGVPPDRASFIYNPLVFAPLAEPAPARAAARAELGAAPAATVLLSVAMFRPEKGQRELIETVAGLPADLDWQLWLAGDGPELAGCRRLVEERKLGGRVKFAGYRADPAPLYAGADLAVHASRSEALSNFLIEAQARGLPAVAMDAQGVRECLIPDQTGFVAPAGDRGSFRAALVRLLREAPATRASRGAAAREFARLTFDPARQVAAHLELFGRLI